MKESSLLSLLQHASPQVLLQAVETERLRRNIEAYRELHATRGYRDEEGVWRGGLWAFIQHFWHILEPATPLVGGWVVEAICEHLEAVTFGEVTRLLMNVMPGAMKSLITDVFWPAWEWGPMKMPHLRYVTFSYSARLTERDNNRFSALVQSHEYQTIYGEWVEPIKTGDQQVSNSAMGWKLASSVGGVGTGARGDRVLLDDPHNVKEAESDIVRTGTVQWFREAMSNRLNSPEVGAIVIIMQRVHEEDVSGVILTLGLPYVHLMIPMEYDPDRQVDAQGQPVATAIGWTDPRYNAADIDGAKGALAWPERWPTRVWETIKNEIGPFATAAQYQQSPEARGGGIFQRSYWQLWDPVDGKFPPLEYVLASLDSAFTEKEENDPSALTVWGVFKNELGNNRIILLNAWRKRLRFRGPKVEQMSGETDLAYQRRSMPHWGLIEWTAYTCRRFKVDRLLIEAKASGISAGQELRRLHGREGWAIELCPVKGDKVARALAVQATFSQQMVYAPIRDWSEMVIDECVVAGTMIITMEGLVAVQDIRVGDMVLTHKGRFRPVLECSRRAATETVTIEGKSLDPVTLTPNHPVLAFDLTVERLLRGKRGVDWVKAGDLTARQYRPVTRKGKQFFQAVPSASHAVVLPIMRPEVEVSEIDLREWATLPTGKKYDVFSDDEVFATSHWRIQSIKWRQRLDRAFGRIIGLYLAEGSSQRAKVSWSFNVKETSFVSEVREFIENRLGCRASQRTQNNSTTIYAGLPLIESFFTECGKGAENKRIPPWVWNAPDQFIKGLIDGYMDGDGHAAKDCMVATTVSKSLAWGIRLLALRMGLNATVRINRGPKSTIIRGRACNTKTAYAVSWRHARQNDGAALIVGDLAAYSIMKKTQGGPAEVFNMTVAEDHSYCTTAGIVHNCAVFPKGRYKDLTDSTTQAIKHLRDNGMANSDEEERYEENEALRHRPQTKALYPC